MVHFGQNHLYKSGAPLTHKIGIIWLRTMQNGSFANRICKAEISRNEPRPNFKLSGRSARPAL
jgi:hypothetical protein